MNPKKKGPKTSDSKKLSVDHSSDSEVPLLDIKQMMNAVMPTLPFAIMGGMSRANANKLIAAFLTYTYTSQTYFYQSEVWDLYKSFLNGLEPKEEDEAD